VLRDDVSLIPLVATGVDTHAPDDRAVALRVGLPADTSPALRRMLERYRRSGRAQNVSFRSLVPWLKASERATHYVHSYPAKLLPQIAHFFLAANDLTEPGDLILDPFGGTGTVALEAMLCGRSAYFADVNPLAQLIARVKTKKISAKKLDGAVARLKRRISATRRRKQSVPDVINVEYWFTRRVQLALAELKQAISHEADLSCRQLFEVCFSTTCRRLSNADPRLSVPVFDEEKTALRREDVVREFLLQISTNQKRLESLSKLVPDGVSSMYVGNDARALRAASARLEVKQKHLPDNSVRLIVTSPPYAGAQKYIRASSLSLGWLGLAGSGQLKALENKSIGREHLPALDCAQPPVTGIARADRALRLAHKVNKLRSHIAATYLLEMKDAIVEMSRVLAPGGHLVLVVGNNQVCGRPFRTADHLADLCEAAGLSLRLKLIDEIKSRGLMTKRNRTASVITREWVMLWQKPHCEKQP